MKNKTQSSSPSTGTQCQEHSRWWIDVGRVVGLRKCQCGRETIGKKKKEKINKNSNIDEI